jgi:hypothetical protein
MVWIAAIGCSWLEPPDEVEEVQAPTPAPQVEQVFVQASLLRLREHPDPNAAFTPLPINSRIRVLERKGEWMRIISSDGRTGWVRAEFTDQAPLSRETARSRAEAAADPAERVMWAERFAALSPGDAGALDGLVKAYRAAGRAEDAQKVEEILKAEEADRFDRWFAVELPESQAISAALLEADRAPELIAVWRRARELTARMGEPLTAGFDPQTQKFIDGDPAPMLAERMPWATVVLYAEGTVPALELAPQVWTQAAGKTPEPWDDEFFSLVTTAYDNASARGWAAWQRRSWDYGGCTPFGTGENLHLELLRQTDRLAKVPEIADVVGEIRAQVLRDIEKPVPDEFEYCQTSGTPTPTSGLLSESSAILAQIQLSETERAKIQGRVDTQFGRVN